MAYARAARSRGAVIVENAPVAALLIEGQRIKGVRMADGREKLADRVALCAGAWSKKLADEAGIALPLQAVEHMYVVTEPMADLPNPFPVLRDLDRGIYIKGDAGKLVFGGFEPDAKCWNAFGPEGDRSFLELPEDWDQFTPFMEAALALMPALETAGIPEHAHARLAWQASSGYNQRSRAETEVSGFRQSENRGNDRRAISQQNHRTWPLQVRVCWLSKPLGIKTKQNW